LSYSGTPDVSTSKARHQEAVTRLAGAAAERIVLGREPLGDENDLQEARNLCRPQCHQTYCDVGLITDADGNPVESQAKRCLNDAKRQAEALVEANIGPIKALADLIMNTAPQYGHRWVSASAVRHLFGDGRLPALKSAPTID
jgi:hypothetical protein